MRGTTIAIEDNPDGQGRRAALIVDGQLDDLLIDPPGGEALVPGAIVRAVMNRPMKGQGAATVRLPDGATGWLREAKGIAPGTPLTVQISTHAEPGKAIPVTTRLTFKSRFAIVTPGAPGLNVARAIRDEELRDRLDLLARDGMDGTEGLGLVIRSAAEAASEEEVAADIADMRALAEAILAEDGRSPELLVAGPDAAERAWRDWPAPDTVDDVPGAFDRHGVNDQIDALRAPRERLSSGAWMSVEPTSALTAVDVNTGGDTSPAAGLKATLAAIGALPRALRLRGLGGQIVIDCAPITKKQRIEVEAAARRAFKRDAVDTQFVGWTPLGHIELIRKRERLPLREVLR
ncbi:ribonuclease E/G [Roseobacter sp. HKCCA0434]|uniref:ribonuclease E/G n=1 Tax=Roseobacter sp. HKCCA0434 TaxID=3079297 RepID=UPI002905D3D5|nr:ribonuclease E/G [Roseobacter sp. HKCCA0434]